MSGRRKRQAAQREQAAKLENERRSFRRLLIVIGAIFVVCAVGAVAAIRFGKPPPVTAATPSPTPEIPKLPTLDQLIAMTPEELAKVDIAVMNLRCAEGLRGAENLDIKEALTLIDQMAERVENQTQRYWYKFTQHPEEFDNSEPYYRMMMLAIVLQEDFRVRYDPSLKVGYPPPEDDHFFDDSRNVLLNGITERQMGSCASLPILYVAVGRRLGYPLKVIAGNSHLYLRWTNSRTQLNVEATSEGFNSHPDGYYWNWPAPVSYKAAEKFELFKPMSPQRELATFLSARSDVLMANDDYENALKFEELAFQVDPSSELLKLTLKRVREYADYRRDFEKKRQEQQRFTEMTATLDSDSTGPRVPNLPTQKWIYSTITTSYKAGHSTTAPYGFQPPARAVPGASPHPR